MSSKGLAGLAVMAGSSWLLVVPAIGQRTAAIQAENRIENQVAVFAALDKVTARISKLEIPLGETVKFGALTVTPKSCYTRSPLEAPKTTTFVEVTETQLDGKQKRIFGGWMFAESPGLNAVEHPVYDVWLTDCAKPKNAAVSPPPRGAPGAAPARGPVPGRGGQAVPPAAQTPPPAGAAGDDLTRRRPPR